MKAIYKIVHTVNVIGTIGIVIVAFMILFKKYTYCLGPDCHKIDEYNYWMPEE